MSSFSISARQSYDKRFQQNASPDFSMASLRTNTQIVNTAIDATENNELSGLDNHQS